MIKQDFESQLKEGSMKSFHDVVNMRKFNYPDYKVCEPTLKGGATKHHVYKVVGKD